jgi:anti-anti-sigma regulatory factor
VTLAIWSLSTAADVDLAGAEMLLHLRGEMAHRGIDFELANAHGPVRAALHAAGLEKHFGPIEANASIASIIRTKGGGPGAPTR